MKLYDFGIIIIILAVTIAAYGSTQVYSDIMR